MQHLLHIHARTQVLSTMICMNCVFNRRLITRVMKHPIRIDECILTYTPMKAAPIGCPSKYEVSGDCKIDPDFDHRGL